MHRASAPDVNMAAASVRGRLASRGRDRIYLHGAVGTATGSRLEGEAKFGAMPGVAHAVFVAKPAMLSIAAQSSWGWNPPRYLSIARSKQGCRLILQGASNLCRHGHA